MKYAFLSVSSYNFVNIITTSASSVNFAYSLKCNDECERGGGGGGGFIMIQPNSLN